MTTRSIATLMVLGGLIGALIALIFIGVLGLIDVEVSSGVVGAVAGAVAGATSVAIARRMRSI